MRANKHGALTRWILAGIFMSMSCAGPGAAHRRSAIHTSYAYVFLAARAERVEEQNLYKARKLYRRANKHYTKAYRTGLERLGKRHPGFNETLIRNPGAAVAMATRQDVPLLYWTAASLGAAVGLSKDQPRMLIRLPQVGVLAFRVTELWPDYLDGAAYELLMVYEASRPAMMGGSIVLAKHYYEQALTHSKGSSASLFVAFGENICVQEQDRDTFMAMMNRALAVKAGGAANRAARKRAKWLRSQVDDLFL